MICLTGDVHHAFGSDEQARYPEQEIELARKYVDIARSYDLSMTLFVTGKAARTAAAALADLSGTEGVEIGGHTYSAFRPQWLHWGLFHRLFRSVYGPRSYQRYDIRQTLDAIEDCAGQRPTVWRTHAYRSTDTTYDELARAGIKSVSDAKRPAARGPQPTDVTGLRELPINVLPDHEHLLHGGRTRAVVDQLIANGWEDAFGPESYPPETWAERVVATIDDIEADGGVATLLIHPGCMKVADDFASFERICEHIDASGYDTATCTDALASNR